MGIGEIKLFPLYTIWNRSSKRLGVRIFTFFDGGTAMKNDNTTPMAASVYDKEINNTIPYYSAFYQQTFEVIEQMNFSNLYWLDLGCGTGSLEKLAFERFTNLQFVVVDPSEKMLQEAKGKLGNQKIQYLCGDSVSIKYDSCFDVATAIQSHHYMQEEERKKATEKVYQALKKGGIYISFENVVPADETIKSMELLRWRKYQQRHGKTEQEAKAHNARCGVNYFPITIEEHMKLMKSAGFEHVHMFWYSYMQMGIYAIK